ncbi:hypothetical protein I6I86_09460 [Moraxella osloensis]|nr:hypothetical protein [Moraxella osloensis]MBL7668169.1 hypothetical protein [Moraxella osloensis]
MALGFFSFKDSSKSVATIAAKPLLPKGGDISNKPKPHFFVNEPLFFVSQSQASQIQASQIQDRRQAYSIPPNFVKIGKNLSS